MLKERSMMKLRPTCYLFLFHIFSLDFHWIFIVFIFPHLCGDHMDSFAICACLFFHFYLLHSNANSFDTFKFYITSEPSFLLL